MVQPKRHAIEARQVLPNGQIADEGTALKETLLAVKEDYEEHKYVGIGCAMKNSGIGVGIPDIGRCILSILKGKIYIRTSAACMGQEIATTTTQMVMHCYRSFFRICRGRCTSYSRCLL